MLQYLRKIRLTAKGSSGQITINPGGIEAHEIKISFDVAKSASSTPNSASIRIWNLKESTRNSLGKELDDITLEAGYIPPGEQGNVGIIFKGQMRDVEHRRDGADIITELSVGDGDKAVRSATISKTYKAGTKVEQIAKDIQAEFKKKGIDQGEFKFPKTMPPFKRPYTVCGGCKREMDTLGRGKGFYWSIQNGTMEIIPSDGFIGQIVLLTPKTGLINTPTITDNGVKFKALLNPEIRPNRRVKIESSILELNSENGEFRVTECNFSGDNRDGDFSVSGTGESIKGGKVDEGKKPE
jgi:hypothetical protein